MTKKFLRSVKESTRLNRCEDVDIRTELNMEDLNGTIDDYK